MSKNVSQPPKFKKSRRVVKSSANREFVSFTQRLAPDMYKRAEKYSKDFGLTGVQDVARLGVARLLMQANY